MADNFIYDTEKMGNLNFLFYGREYGDIESLIRIMRGLDRLQLNYFS